MFRPAGFSDSEDDRDQGFSSRRQSSEDEEPKTFSLRRARDTGGGQKVEATIPWDTINNNSQASVNMSSSDTIVSDPALIQVLEKTKKYLRSTLLSHKGGVEMHTLNSDYRELVGEGIPYTKLNFNGLETLLRSLPSVCSLWRSGGEVMVKGVAGEASQHIQNMVSMQKSTMKGKSRKRGKGKKCSVNGRGQSGFDREMDSWHRQFAAPSPPPPARPYRALPQPPQRRVIASVQQPVRLVKARVDPAAQNATMVTRRCLITTDIVVCGNRVRELLKGRLHGLYVAQVEKMYEKKFGENLSENWCDVLGASGVVVVKEEAGGLVLVKSGEGGSMEDVTTATDGDIVSKVVLQDDAGMVRDRVVQLLQGRVYGLLVSQVEKMYANQWGDELRGNWIKGVEQSGGVMIDREGEQVLLKINVNGARDYVDKNMKTSKYNPEMVRVVNGVGLLSVTGNNNAGPADGGRRIEVIDKVRQVGRVKQLLQGRVHGLFVAQVEMMHLKQFGETLPSLWWKGMEMAGCVVVERMESSQMLVRWMKEDDDVL